NIDHILLLNDSTTTKIYTLSLHDALPIYNARTPHEPSIRPKAPPARANSKLSVSSCRTMRPRLAPMAVRMAISLWRPVAREGNRDRKSTRLNSSHVAISYAVFCLKKKKKQ